MTFQVPAETMPAVAAQTSDMVQNSGLMSIAYLAIGLLLSFFLLKLIIGWFSRLLENRRHAADRARVQEILGQLTPAQRQVVLMDIAKRKIKRLEREAVELGDED